MVSLFVVWTFDSSARGLLLPKSISSILFSEKQKDSQEKMAMLYSFNKVLMLLGFFDKFKRPFMKESICSMKNTLISLINVLARSHIDREKDILILCGNSNTVNNTLLAECVFGLSPWLV